MSEIADLVRLGLSREVLSVDEESIVARVAQKRSRRRRSARLRRIAIASLAFLMAGTGVVLAAQALRTHRSTASHLSRPRPARNGSIAIVLDTVGKERDVLSLFTSWTLREELASRLSACRSIKHPPAPAGLWMAHVSPSFSRTTTPSPSGEVASRKRTTP